MSQPHNRVAGILVVAFFTLVGFGAAPRPTDAATAGLSYTNYRVAEVPWSIHVIQVPRASSAFDVRSTHANGAAVGLTILTAQVDQVRNGSRAPVAAVNGDFYSRRPVYAGDPRGLQIIDGEIISAPNGGVAFWVDAAGRPHGTNVQSRFEVAWPGGTRTPLGLNEERQGDAVQLYTPAVGTSTHTTGGRELILEPAPNSPWLPLQIGQTYRAKVREVRETGDSPLPPDSMVLSVGPERARNLPAVATGEILQFTTASLPDLAGAPTAIGGGPALVRAGRRLKIVPPTGESYEFTSMIERHPRTAIGWNRENYFLVVVDGRQKALSAGMTLEELATWLAKLGCLEAINLDGGGSATMWYDGRVRNSPCDGRERPIANSLIVVRRDNPAGAGHADVDGLGAK